VQASPVLRCARYLSSVLLRVLVSLLVLQLLDLGLLVVLSRSIGFWTTLVALLGVGFVGGAFARRESGRVWRSFQSALGEGRPPEHGILDGMLVLLGGVLLLLPGVLSDVIGLSLFVPPLRRALARRLRERWSKDLGAAASRAAWSAPHPGLGEPPARPGPAGPPVIDTTGVESPE
jgi:UPF0716 protein FxsA